MNYLEKISLLSCVLEKQMLLGTFYSFGINRVALVSSYFARAILEEFNENIEEAKIITNIARNSQNLKIAFFDWDGTVTDTHMVALKAFKRVYLEISGKEEEFLPFWNGIDGMSGAEQVEIYRDIARKNKNPFHYKDGVDFVETIIKIRQEIMEEDFQGEIPLVKDIEEVFKDLCSQGIKIHIASGLSTKELRRQIDKLEFAKYFSGVFGSASNFWEKYTLPKTKAGYITKTLKKKKISCNNAVMFGDTISDAKNAQKAGVDFIGRAFDQKREKELFSESAKIVVRDYINKNKLLQDIENNLRKRVEQDKSISEISSSFFGGKVKKILSDIKKVFFISSLALFLCAVSAIANAGQGIISAEIYSFVMGYMWYFSAMFTVVAGLFYAGPVRILAKGEPLSFGFVWKTSLVIIASFVISMLSMGTEHIMWNSVFFSMMIFSSYLTLTSMQWTAIRLLTKTSKGPERDKNNRKWSFERQVGFMIKMIIFSISVALLYCIGLSGTILAFTQILIRNGPFGPYDGIRQMQFALIGGGKVFIGFVIAMVLPYYKLKELIFPKTFWENKLKHILEPINDISLERKKEILEELPHIFERIREERLSYGKVAVMEKTKAPVSFSMLLEEEALEKLVTRGIKEDTARVLILLAGEVIRRNWTLFDGTLLKLLEEMKRALNIKQPKTFKKTIFSIILSVFLFLPAIVNAGQTVFLKSNYGFGLVNMWFLSITIMLVIYLMCSRWIRLLLKADFLPANFNKKICFLSTIIFSTSLYLIRNNLNLWNAIFLGGIIMSSYLTITLMQWTCRRVCFNGVRDLLKITAGDPDCDKEKWAIFSEIAAICTAIILIVSTPVIFLVGFGAVSFIFYKIMVNSAPFKFGDPSAIPLALGGALNVLNGFILGMLLPYYKVKEILCSNRFLRYRNKSVLNRMKDISQERKEEIVDNLPSILNAIKRGRHTYGKVVVIARNSEPLSFSMLLEKNASHKLVSRGIEEDTAKVLILLAKEHVRRKWFLSERTLLKLLDEVKESLNPQKNKVNIKTIFPIILSAGLFLSSLARAGGVKEIIMPLDSFPWSMLGLMAPGFAGLIAIMLTVYNENSRGGPCVRPEGEKTKKEKHQKEISFFGDKGSIKKIKFLFIPVILMIMLVVFISKKQKTEHSENAKETVLREQNYKKPKSKTIKQDFGSILKHNQSKKTNKPKTKIEERSNDFDDEEMSDNIENSLFDDCGRQLERITSEGLLERYLYFYDCNIPHPAYINRYYDSVYDSQGNLLKSVTRGTEKYDKNRNLIGWEKYGIFSNEIPWEYAVDLIDKEAWENEYWKHNHKTKKHIMYKEDGTVDYVVNYDANGKKLSKYDGYGRMHYGILENGQIIANYYSADSMTPYPERVVLKDPNDKIIKKFKNNPITGEVEEKAENLYDENGEYIGEIVKDADTSRITERTDRFDDGRRTTVYMEDGSSLEIDYAKGTFYINEIREIDSNGTCVYGENYQSEGGKWDDGTILKEWGVKSDDDGFVNIKTILPLAGISSFLLFLPSLARAGILNEGLGTFSPVFNCIPLRPVMCCIGVGLMSMIIMLELMVGYELVKGYAKGYSGDEMKRYFKGEISGNRKLEKIFLRFFVIAVGLVYFLGVFEWSMNAVLMMGITAISFLWTIKGVTKMIGEDYECVGKFSKTYAFRKLLACVLIFTVIYMSFIGPYLLDRPGSCVFVSKGMSAEGFSGLLSRIAGFWSYIFLGSSALVLGWLFFKNLTKPSKARLILKNHSFQNVLENASPSFRERLKLFFGELFRSAWKHKKLIAGIVTAFILLPASTVLARGITGFGVWQKQIKAVSPYTRIVFIGIVGILYYLYVDRPVKKYCEKGLVPLWGQYVTDTAIGIMFFYLGALFFKIALTNVLDQSAGIFIGVNIFTGSLLVVLSLWKFFKIIRSLKRSGKDQQLNQNDQKAFKNKSFLKRIYGFGVKHCTKSAPVIAVIILWGMSKFFGNYFKAIQSFIVSCVTAPRYRVIVIAGIFVGFVFGNAILSTLIKVFKAGFGTGKKTRDGKNETIFKAKQKSLKLFIKDSINKYPKETAAFIAIVVFLTVLKLWSKKILAIKQETSLVLLTMVLIFFLYYMAKKIYTLWKEGILEKDFEKKIDIKYFSFAAGVMINASMCMIATVVECICDNNINWFFVIIGVPLGGISLKMFYLMYRLKKMTKIENSGIVVGVIGQAEGCCKELDERYINKGIKIFAIKRGNVEVQQKQLEQSRRKYNAYYAGVIDTRGTDIDKKALKKMVFELIRKIKHNKDVRSFHFKPENIVLDNKKARELKEMINEIMSSSVIVSNGLSELDIYDYKITKIGRGFNVPEKIKGLKEKLIKLEKKQEFKVISFKVNSMTELKWLAGEHQKAIDKYADGNPEKYPVHLHVRLDNENVKKGKITRGNIEQLLCKAGISKQIINPNEVLLGEEGDLWDITDYIIRKCSKHQQALDKEDILIVNMHGGIPSQGYLAALKVVLDPKNVPDQVAGMNINLGNISGIMYLYVKPINPIDIQELRQEIENYEKLLIAA
ncbi:MAG: HAD hydrolase-like protein [Candidatus Omnitrophota bacterium]